MDTSLILADTPDGILVNIKGNKIKLALIISTILQEDKILKELFTLVKNFEGFEDNIKEILKDVESKG